MKLSKKSATCVQKVSKWPLVILKINVKNQHTSYFAFIQLLPLASHALLIIVMFIFTKFMLPWVPEVFLACGGNFQCSLKADTSIDQETRNRARKVSGTYGKFISKGKLKRSEVWCYITMVARIYRELFEQKNSFLHIFVHFLVIASLRLETS